MAKIIKDIISYPDNEIEMNYIGAKGCLYLSKAKWPSLTKIDLCNHCKTEGKIVLGQMLVKI